MFSAISITIKILVLIFILFVIYMVYNRGLNGFISYSLKQFSKIIIPLGKFFSGIMNKIA